MFYHFLDDHISKNYLFNKKCKELSNNIIYDFISCDNSLILLPINDTLTISSTSSAILQLIYSPAIIILFAHNIFAMLYLISIFISIIFYNLIKI